MSRSRPRRPSRPLSRAPPAPPCPRLATASAPRARSRTAPPGEGPAARRSLTAGDRVPTGGAKSAWPALRREAEPLRAASNRGRFPASRGCARAARSRRPRGPTRTQPRRSVDPRDRGTPPRLSAASPAAAGAACSAASPAAAAPPGAGALPAPPPRRRPRRLHHQRRRPPERNSTIQSAVSDRTSSVTSSENRRSTPRHRSAASLAVPSVGPSTSRTHSDAQSNCSACSRRCTACAVATSLIQPEVSPKYRSHGQAGRAQQQRQIPPAAAPRPPRPSARAAAARPRRSRPERRADPQHPRRPPLPHPVRQIPLGRAQRARLDPPVQLVEALRGLAPVAERERPARSDHRPRPASPALAPGPGAAPRAASPAGSPGHSSTTDDDVTRVTTDVTLRDVRCACAS